LVLVPALNTEFECKSFITESLYKAALQPPGKPARLLQGQTVKGSEDRPLKAKTNKLGPAVAGPAFKTLSRLAGRS